MIEPQDQPPIIPQVPSCRTTSHLILRAFLLDQRPSGYGNITMRLIPGLNLIFNSQTLPMAYYDNEASPEARIEPQKRGSIGRADREPASAMSETLGTVPDRGRVSDESQNGFQHFALKNLAMEHLTLDSKSDHGIFQPFSIPSLANQVMRLSELNCSIDFVNPFLSTQLIMKNSKRAELFREKRGSIINSYDVRRYNVPTFQRFHMTRGNWHGSTIRQLD